MPSGHAPSDPVHVPVANSPNFRLDCRTDRKGYHAHGVLLSKAVTDRISIVEGLPMPAADIAATEPAVLYEKPFRRHKTRVVEVGSVPVGGDNPIIVQSMTTPDTNQLEAVLKEIRRLEEAGCELVRVTVPKPE